MKSRTEYLCFEVLDAKPPMRSKQSMKLAEREIPEQARRILGRKHFKALVVLGTVTLAGFVFAADQKQARITEIVRDVRLLEAKTAARPAVVNDTVRESAAVRTGADSRTELVFSDQTLTRLGANTVFSFSSGERTLDGGVILVSAPRSAGTVGISTKVVTVAVSGFTVILERHDNAWNKFIVLHGNGTFRINGITGHPMQLHTGQMVVFPARPTNYPRIVDIDLAKLLNGNLVKGFKTRLPELNLILQDIQNQRKSPPSGGLIDPTGEQITDQAINARPTPPPVGIKH